MMMTVAAGLWLAGCGRNSDGPLPEALPPAKATVKLEQAFGAASPVDPAVMEQVKAATTALKNKDHLAAFDALQGLKAFSASTLTVEQDRVVRDALLGVSETVARAAAAGDAKAIAIEKQMQR
jgi:hypothetical protein